MFMESRSVVVGQRCRLDCRRLHPHQPVDLCALYRSAKPPRRLPTACLAGLRQNPALDRIEEFADGQPD